VSFIFVFLCGLFSGALIGAAGIGGVVLVPLLVYGAGYDIHISIAAAVSSFIFSGLIGTFAYARRGEINWLQLIYLTIGATPGALVGTHTLAKVNADTLKLFIAIVLIFAACRQIANLKAKRLESQSNPSKMSLLFVGFLTACLSVLSGTGGPLVLVPILTFLSMPLLAVIGLSQAIQIPIALFATIGNQWSGIIRWEIVALLSPGLVLGTFLGAKASECLPVDRIRSLVAFLLLGSGIYMLINLIFV
jgi:uncharacterized membrane protein YfcA